MATQNREQLKVWFKKGAYPTAAQFADLIDSFYHKNDTFKISVVDDLADQINGKYSKESGETLETEHKALVLEFINHKTVSDEKFGGIYDKIEVVENGVSALQTMVSDIGIMLKNGATLEQAKAALTALGTDYKDLYSVASTLKKFLKSADTANATINTWAEIEKFLNGVSDTTSLTALMVEMEAKIIAAVDTARNDVLSGIDFQGEGNVVTDITHDSSTKRMTVTKGTLEGGGGSGGLFINDKTVENCQLAVDVARGDLVMQERICRYNTISNDVSQFSAVGGVFSMSKNGDYLVSVNDDINSFMPLLFERSGDQYTCIARLEQINATFKDCSLSADGCYLALLFSAAPNLIICKNTAGVLTKLTSIEALNDNTCNSCSLNSDGRYLSVTSDNGIFFYKRTGDNFAKIPSANIAGRYRDCSFSYDGVYFATRKMEPNSITNGMAAEIYKRSIDVFNKIGSLGIGSQDKISGIDLSGDGMYLALTRSTIIGASGSALYIHSISNDTVGGALVKAPTVITNTPCKCSISPDGTYALLAAEANTKIYKYWHGRLDLIDMPDGNILNGSFSYDGTYLATRFKQGVSITRALLKLQQTDVKVMPAIIKSPTSTGRGVALEDGFSGETKKILMLEKYV